MDLLALAVRAGRQCRSSRSLAALSALPAEPERPSLLPSAPRPDSWSNGPIGDFCPRREIVSAGAAKAGNFKRSIGRYSYQKSLRSVSRSRPAEVDPAVRTTVAGFLVGSW